jgi:hypothetical protein
MRLRITPAGPGQLRWTLTRSPEANEQIADSVRTYADVGACCRAAAAMLSARAECMAAIQQPDGRWRWAVRDEDGLPLAQSSTAFQTAAACGYALHNLRTEWLSPR